MRHTTCRLSRGWLDAYTAPPAQVGWAFGSRSSACPWCRGSCWLPLPTQCPSRWAGGPAGAPGRGCLPAQRAVTCIQTGIQFVPTCSSSAGAWDVSCLNSTAAPILTPVPCGLQHAVWHQAAILAVMLACLPRQHQLSVARVAAADQHYTSAAQALLTAASALLPPGPSGWCARELPRLLGPPGAFYLVHSALLLLGALATLAVNFWFEVPRRVAFACENGMASAVDALMRR